MRTQKPMLRKLPQKLADGRQGQPGLFGQAASGMRRLFRAARYVRHQHNAVIRQFIESEHRFLRSATTRASGRIQYQSSIILSFGRDEYKTGMVLIQNGLS
jgi:hypothetical protein